MDITQIILAVLGGGLAALVGLVIGTMLPGGGQGAGVRWGNVLAIGLAVAGARLAPPILEPILGQKISVLLGRDPDSASELGSQVTTLFETQPLFMALAEADPLEAGRIRALVEEAYLAGGEAAAIHRFEDLARELGERAVQTYGPRSSDEALRNFFMATRDWGYGMRDSPQKCYTAFYGNIASIPATTTEVTEAVSGSDTSGVLAAMTEVVRSAESETIPFDAVRMAEIQAEVGTSLLESFTVQDLRFMLGAIPQSRDEMQIACDSMLTTIDLMLAHEESAVLLRGSAASF